MHYSYGLVHYIVYTVFNKGIRSLANYEFWFYKIQKRERHTGHFSSRRNEMEAAEPESVHCFDLGWRVALTDAEVSYSSGAGATVN